ncbi:hypothetical protein F0P96_02005 [Hymenobacter busanensis]|uniref:Uncharacterized protein n=1 Tax=Hymenobacter busanensis TaxID=2607656 RepID=A0A7L4ZTV1_9BACT|nr:hypothetical protein [Hymenobacter busanensis]KAA9339416.1 hypothetical protein F0P96_02005 [Hymenobacter busanensis]QHJ06824.1 hypothetical protein GUY19_05745 [Hymenobacter busanensis]
MDKRTASLLLGMACLAAATLLARGTADPAAFRTVFQLISLTALGFVVYQSTLLQHRRYFVPLAVAVAGFLVSLLWKIQHWPGASWLLAVSLAAVVLLYAVRFVRKPSKSLEDVLKVLWVVTYSAGVYLTVEQLPHASAVLGLGTAVFWLLVFVFIYTRFMRPAQ